MPGRSTSAGCASSIGSPADAVRLRHRLPLRGPQALRAGARHGRRDQRGAGLLPTVPGPLGTVNTHRTSSIAVQRVEELGIKTPSTRPEGPQPVRRQPAEGRRRQVADRRDRHPHLRRAHARASTSAPRARSTTCSTSSPSDGQGDHHDLLRAARDPAHEPPHPRHVRGTDDGRAVRRRGDPGEDHDARDTSERPLPRQPVDEEHR